MFLLAQVIITGFYSLCGLLSTGMFLREGKGSRAACCFVFGLSFIFLFIVNLIQLVK
jgi:hypothetical protein